MIMTKRRSHIKRAKVLRGRILFRINGAAMNERSRGDYWARDRWQGRMAQAMCGYYQG